MPLLDREELREEVGKDCEGHAARGNETVPTVKVGSELLVNPTAGQVLATAHRIDPNTQLPLPPAPGKLARVLSRLLGGSPG